MLNDSLQVGDEPLCTTSSEKRPSSFILLLKQVLRLLCLARGWSFMRCIRTPCWSNASDLGVHSARRQPGPFLTAPTRCLLCQLFLLILLLCSISPSAVSRSSPICSSPLLLFFPPQPLTGFQCFQKGYSSIDQSAQNLPFFFFFPRRECQSLMLQHSCIKIVQPGGENRFAVHTFQISFPYFSRLVTFNRNFAEGYKNYPRV